MSRRFVGERVLQKCGEYAEIIELLPDNRRCRIRFDSGVEKECLRQGFSKGIISNKGVHYCQVGDKYKQKCGRTAEIFELLPDGRCKVRFESGLEKECFRSSVVCGSLRDQERSYRYVGEVRMQNCGSKAEIVKLLPRGKCLVRFESGFEKECKRGSFADGSVQDENYFVKEGDQVFQRCGMNCECIKLLEDAKCLVRFENGVEKVVPRYLFKEGKLSHRERSKVGDEVMQTRGYKAKIVKILPNRKCLIEFEDGNQKECFAYEFRNGRVLNDKAEPNCFRHNKYGMKYTIKHLEGDLRELTFEDGSNVVVEGKVDNRYPSYIKGGRYTKTGDRIVSVRFNEKSRSYEGVLRRADGYKYSMTLN